VDIQDTTVHALFEAQVARTPNQIAVLLGKQSLSYDALNKAANQLAHYLLALGLKQDTPVAICIDRSFACLITILAILKAGAAYLPIDSEHPSERLSFILSDSKASFLIANSHYEHKFSQYQGRLVLLEKEAQTINKQSMKNPLLDIKSEQLAYVIYTSGSTGTPKGVLIEHRSVVNYCFWFTGYCSPKPKQRIDFSSNHTFDMAVTISIAPLMLGLTVVICDDEIKKNVRHYLKYLKSSKVNLIKLTPSYFKVLLQEINSKFIALPYLETIILGGENLPAVDCKSWLNLYPKHVLYNEYGPTETTVGISQYSIRSMNLADLEINVPIGTLGTNISCIILDENQNPVPSQEIGELYIGGACLARGYLNRPELTQRQFIQSPFKTGHSERLYKTGDLCRLRSDGVLEYFGRIDSQVKIRGFRIEPGEIETHLIEHPDIEAVIVLAQKDPLNEDRLVAYYILKDANKAPNASQLRQHLQTHLPDYMIPTAFIRVHSFPLTANGKLDKSLLPIPQLTASQKHREPSTILEKTLAEIWAAELGVKAIGLDDDFFELGGHSLSAARIISKINRELGKNITVPDFYYSPSLAKLAEVISKNKKRIKKPRVRNAKLFNKLADIPLSDFQFMLWISNTFESKAKKLNITTRKRLQGQLDVNALERAFNAVLKKHEVLFYHILKFRPAQLIQKNLCFKITEINLRLISGEETESILEESMNQLMDYYPWPKDSPLIIGKLFHLKNDRVELQIGIPHIVSDDFSPEIILADLSDFYLKYSHCSDTMAIKADTPYKEYILNEQQYMKKNVDRDTLFWEDYLKDAGLFAFPPENVIKNMTAKKLPYSTYTKLPESALSTLKQFCSNNHISIKDGLCAAVALALHRCSANEVYETPYTYINIIKSTRNSDVYDATIGCFLRLEPVKIRLDKQATLTSISGQIHQSTIDTSLYQQCPDLVKLSSIKTFRQKRKIIKNFLINVVTSIYTTIFSVPEINRKIFKLCNERLNSCQLASNFLININVHRNFIAAPKKNKLNLFGLDTTKIKSHHYDLLKIDNVLDVCFLRDDNQSSPYLVISANLRPEFRELIAKETIRIIGSTPLKKPTETKAPVLS
jgi:amino acid adenylation domain-containing protein